MDNLLKEKIMSEKLKVNFEVNKRSFFYTPYMQYQNYIGRPFIILGFVEDVDDENKGNLFNIKFIDNGEEIQAWSEEIYEN